MLTPTMPAPRTIMSGILVLVMVFAIAWSGCSLTPATGPVESVQELPPEPADGIPIEKSAICVWPFAGLRMEAGRQDKTKEGEDNYLLAVVYGEKVELLGGEKEIESEDRVYIEVKLKSGESGWVHDYLFEKSGRLAVMTQSADIHRRPDPMTLRDEQFEPGEIIVVIEDSLSSEYNQWFHVSGREKKKKGWIARANVLTFEERDVRLALYYLKAIQERKVEALRAKLEEIYTDSAFIGSPLIPLVEEKIRETAQGTGVELPLFPAESKLFITNPKASLHREPQATSDNILKTLKQGDVCVVLSQGDRASIGGANDYWYQIRHGESEGWVFGYYTSRRVLD